MTKTILVVEDDSMIRGLLRDALEGEGYRVITAENGREGISQLRENPGTSLVLLDLTMPIMNGSEFLAFVRNDAELSLVPVVVVSAAADSMDTTGSVEVIRKPIDLDTLFRAVSAHSAT